MRATPDGHVLGLARFSRCTVGTVVLKVECCSGIEHAEEIKALFRRNGRPGFIAVFDRTYPQLVAAGGMKWVARDEGGGIVGHLAAFPRVFRDAERVARGVLLADLLVDGAHRNFWSAVALCRRAVADVSAAGAFQFAYTDPTPQAQALVRAAGFRSFGNLQRFVLPLQSLYVRFFRAVCRAAPARTERVDGPGDPRVAECIRGMPADTLFRAERSIELYTTRVAHNGSGRLQWLLHWQDRDPRGSAAAFVLAAAEAGARVLNIVDLVWDRGRVAAPTVLHAVARHARDEGFRRVSVVTLAESALAGTLRRSGFMARPDVLPLVIHPMRDGAALPPATDWVFTTLDGSAW